MGISLRIAVAVCVLLVSGAGLFALRLGNICDEDVRSEPLPAIVSAFGVETEAVRAHLEIHDTCSYEGVSYVVGSTGGTKVLFYESGIGQEAVRDTTQRTLENFSVLFLVFSGIAGGVDDTLRLGETVVARGWLDVGTGETVALDPEMVTLAETVQSVRVVELGATADYFVTDTSMLPPRVSVVDMETYMFVRVAADAGVPHMVFRSVSDHADGTETTAGFVYAANASARAGLAFTQLYRAD